MKTEQKRVLVRIDDLGIYDPSTTNFISALCSGGLHVSCGVVPLWLTNACRNSLIDLSLSFPACVEVHQHGYSHNNQSASEEKYEFGPGRIFDEELKEISDGRQILEDAFGGLFYPAFSPAFGFCDLNLTALLVDAGFSVVSGIRGNAIPSKIPMFSPDVDCFLWDPTRERRWEEIVSDWQSRRDANFGGIVLHPRLMTRESMEFYSNQLPLLLENTRSLTFAQLNTVGSSIEL
jgi:hypothetical protein